MSNGTLIILDNKKPLHVSVQKQNIGHFRKAFVNTKHFLCKVMQFLKENTE